MIQVGLSGTQFLGSAKDKQALREFYKKNKYLKFSELIEPDLRKHLRKGLIRKKFKEISYPDLSPSLELNLARRDKIEGLLLMFFNCDHMKKLVSQITSQREINRFMGRIYKMLPGHAHNWHDDWWGGRRVTVSVNLGGHFDGGEISFRQKKDHKVLRKLSNRRAGEAILFGVSPRLEHRVNRIRGRRPKFSFVGWYSK